MASSRRMTALSALACIASVAVATRFLPAEDAATRQFADNPVPSCLSLLMTKEVRVELKVTSRQYSLIAELAGNQRLLPQPPAITSRAPSAHELEVARLRQLENWESHEQEIRRQLAVVLDAAQMKRLRGLIAQRYTAVVTLNDPDFACDLQLSKDQQQVLADERNTYLEWWSRRSDSVEYEAGRERLRAGDERAIAVLTRDQQDRFRELRGREFEFPSEMSIDAIKAALEKAERKGDSPAPLPDDLNLDSVVE